MALQVALLKSNIRNSSQVANRLLSLSACRSNSHVPQIAEDVRDKYYPYMGNRDWVGYGINGSPQYVENLTYPFPAVRWKENTDDVLALRKKELGDWKQLTMEEKKALYRASYRQTFAEYTAPTGEWKIVATCVMLGISLTIWTSAYIKKFIMNPLPATISEEGQKELLEFIVKERYQPLSGPSALWDYEAGDWKKNVKK